MDHKENKCWGDSDGNQIYKIGRTEEITGRMKKYNYSIPNGSYRLHGLLKCKYMNHTEKQILSKLQENGLQHNTLEANIQGTTTSEFFTNFEKITNTIKGLTQDLNLEIIEEFNKQGNIEY